MRRLLLAILALSSCAVANTTAGYTSTGSTNSGHFGSIVIGIPIFAPINSNAGICPIPIASDGSGTGHIVCALYDSDGAGGTIKTPLCQSAPVLVNTSNTTYNIDLTTPCAAVTFVPNHKYFLTSCADDNGIGFFFDGLGNWQFQTSTTCNGSLPVLTSTTSSNDVFSISLTWINSLTSHGNIAIGSGGSSGQNNNTIASGPFVASGGETFHDVEVFMKAAPSGNLNCGIYSGNPATTLVCQGTPQASAIGAFNIVALSGCGTATAAQTYWSGCNVDNSSDQWAVASGSVTNTYFQTQVCCNLLTLVSPSTSTSFFTEFMDLGAATVRHKVIASQSQNYRNIAEPGNGLEPVAGMGWSITRNKSTTLTDTLIKSNADALVSTGMLAAGYNTIGPDINWITGASSGVITVNTTDYPGGMAALCTYIHSDGEQCQMYLNINSCTGFQSVCASQVAGYGADYVKYDTSSGGNTWPSNPAAQAEFTAMGNGIKASGRTMRYLVSISNNSNNFYGQLYWCPAALGQEVWGFQDSGSSTWSTVLAEVDAQTYVNPGCWTLIDYLGVGADSSLTATEMQSQMALFTILTSPLVASIDLTTDCSGACTSSSTVIVMLNNANVLGVSKDALAVAGTQISNVACGGDACTVYKRTIANGEAFVALDRASSSQAIAITWGGGSRNVYDLINGTSLGALTSYTPTVVSHGTAMIATCTGGTSWNTGVNPHKCQ